MKYLVIRLLLLVCVQTVYGQYLQEIRSLHLSDPVFKAIVQDILKNQKFLAKNDPSLTLEIFTYTLQSSDTIHSVAARLNIPYDTIATLNNISSLVLFPKNKAIYLPNMAGLVIRYDSQDPFLIEIQNSLKNKKHINFLLPDPSSKTKGISAKFYPNHRFNRTARTTFLLGFFLPPLHGIRCIITSGFGKRSSPTKKGKWEYHTGIDYSAPLNSAVQSSHSGTVQEIGTDQVLGRYILIQHEKNLQTVYGHLSHFFVRKGEKVSSGQIIAKSGDTGRTTGPHLHFEIRKKGIPINPRPFLKVK